MCAIDLDPCDVWLEKPRLARKAHLCDGCGTTIKPRSPYLVHFDVFEGAPNSEKCCYRCWLAREEFAEAHGQSFTPSSIEPMLDECISGADPGDPETKRWRRLQRSVLGRARRARAARAVA